MKFDYIRIYEESEIKNRYSDKYRIAFVKNGDKSERIECNGKSIFFSNYDNVKLYYPQNYKEFLKMLKSTKVEGGEIKVYEVYSGSLLSHDYKNRNHCYYQDKTKLIDLIILAKEYFINKDLPLEKQEAQKSLFIDKCKEVLSKVLTERNK